MKIRKLLAISLVLAIVLSAAACASPQPAPAPAPSPPEGEPETPELGGTLVVYGWTGNWDLWFRDWAEEFYEETGVTIQYVSGPGSVMRERIIAENASGHDIFIGTPGDTFSLMAGGFLADIPWDQIPSAQHIDSRFKYEQVGIWGYDFQGPSINTDFLSLEDAPTTLRQLVDPEWRGRLGLPQLTFETAVRLPSLLIDVYGEEEGLDLTRRIYENAGILFDSPGRMESAIATGEADLALISLGSANVAYHQAGGNVRMLVPEEGVYLMLNSLSIAQDAPNMEAAIAFVEFYLSAKRQNNIMNELGISIAVNSSVPLNNEELFEVVGGVDLHNIRMYVPDWVELSLIGDDGLTNHERFLSELADLIRG